MKIIFRLFFLVFLSNALYGQAVEVDLQSVDQERDAFIEEMVETHNFDRPQLTRILSNIDIDFPFSERVIL